MYADWQALLVDNYQSVRQTPKHSNETRSEHQC